MAEKYEILRATNYNIRAQISDYLKSLDARLKEVEGGGGGINGQYLWSTLTTGDPTAGHIATNNADYASATEVRVHKLSNAGNDLTVIIQPLKIGSLLGIFEVNAPAATALYRTTAIPVLTGDYFTISVSAEPFTGQSLPTVQDSDLNVTFTASTDVGDYMIYTYTDVDYTVQYHNECVFVDSATPVTITLPASPEKDDYAGVWDAGNSAALNNITILRNGNTIADRDEDAVIDMNGGRFDLCYDDANTWKLAHVLGCIPYDADIPITDIGDIPNLALWLDGDDISTLYQTAGTQPFGLGTNPVTVTADPVGCWADKSGNNYHMNQGTAADRAIYTSSAAPWTTGAVRTFNGGDDNLFATSSVLTQSQNVVIFYTGALIDAEGRGAVYCNSNTATERITAYMDGRNAERDGGRVDDSTGAAVSKLPADIGAEPHQFTVIITGGEVTTRLDGVAGTPASIPGDGVTTNDYTRVFSQISGFTKLYGFIGDLVVVNGPLTASQIEDVEGILKTKRGTP